MRNESGSLLDIGARDRRLAVELNSQKISYYSADLDRGHDFQVNLEAPLDLSDCAFDYVVALDVLEHLEHIHGAFHELARITSQKLIIALPNMGTLPRRWSYLWHGHLGTGKYDLYPEHQGDRHRWLTVYPQIKRFIESNAAQAGFMVEEVIEEIEVGVEGKVGAVIAKVGKWAIGRGLLPSGMLSGRSIYVLVRRSAKC
ncbi:MAG: methyltransferase domain-containing protein [Ardenticatenaceae bacterium]